MPRLDAETGLKICTGCNIPKIADDFNRSSYSFDGYRHKCRECEIKIKRAHIEANRERVNALGRIASAKYYGADSRRRTLKNSQFSARRAGVPHSITLEDIHIPEYCPLERCGHRRLERGNRTNTDSSPSLDRYYPSLGYVPGNVWIICLGCNRAKQDMSGEEHMFFGQQLVDAFKEECERVAKLSSQE